MIGWGLGDSQMVSYLLLSSSGMAVSPTLRQNATLQNELASRLDEKMLAHNLTMERIFKEGILKYSVSYRFTFCKITTSIFNEGALRS